MLIFFFQNILFQNKSLNDEPTRKDIKFYSETFSKLKEIQVFPIANEDDENILVKLFNSSSLEIIPEPKIMKNPYMRTPNSTLCCITPVVRAVFYINHCSCIVLYFGIRNCCFFFSETISMRLKATRN